MRLGEDFFNIRRLCDITSHGDRFAPLGSNVRNDAISAFLARGIVDDNGRAFRRKTFGDSRANMMHQSLPLPCQTICSCLCSN